MGIDGLKESLGAAEHRISPERVTELLLITQYFDTLEKMSHGQSTTIFLPHQVGGIADVAEQHADGRAAGRSGGAGNAADHGSQLTLRITRCCIPFARLCGFRFPLALHLFSSRVVPGPPLMLSQC